MRQFKTLFVVVLLILSTTINGQITYLTNKMSGAQVRAAINANMNYFDDLISDTITVPLTNNRGIATKMNTNIFWLSKYFDLEDQVVLTNKMRGSEVRAALNRNFELLKNRDQNYVEFKSIQPATINQLIIRHSSMPSSNVFLDWGDGNVSTLATGTSIINYSNYSTSDTTYTVRIFGQLKEILYFDITSEPTVNYINLTSFSKMKQLKYLKLSLLGVTGWSGNIDSLPNSLVQLELYGNAVGMNVTGTTANFPRSLSRLQLRSFKNANITGSISDLSDSLKVLYLTDNWQMIYDISSLPSKLTSFYVDSYYATKKLVGTIDSLPWSLKEFSSVAPVSLAELTGSTNNLPPGLKVFNGSNAVNITGDARLLPSGLNVFYLTGATNFTVTSGEFPMWGGATITLQNEWTTEEVDTFLNSWQTNCATGVKTINLAGTNQPRSSASDAAVTDMQSNHSKTFVFTTP
jgi:hypothetical protein